MIDRGNEPSDSVSRVKVGRHTYGHHQITVRHWGEPAQLVIGSFCSIADRCVVFLGGNHRVDWITTFPFPALAEQWPAADGIAGHPSTNGDVVVGNDVWIGSNVTIMSGVSIGDGAVIAANSCVTRSIPPYAIAGGNPATVLRQRFSTTEVQKLLEIRWWDWSDDRISESLDLLCSGDLASFIDRYGLGGESDSSFPVDGLNGPRRLPSSGPKAAAPCDPSGAERALGDC